MCGRTKKPWSNVATGGQVGGEGVLAAAAGREVRAEVQDMEDGMVAAVGVAAIMMSPPMELALPQHAQHTTAVGTATHRRSLLPIMGTPHRRMLHLHRSRMAGMAMRHHPQAPHSPTRHPTAMHRRPIATELLYVCPYHRFCQYSPFQVRVMVC